MKLTDEQRAALLAERDLVTEARRAADARLREIEAALAADRVARLADLDAQTAGRDLGVRQRERDRRREAEKRAKRAGRDANPPHWLDDHEDRHDQEEGVA